MCGIVGYIGKKKASPILLNGLTRLEYRGYDSAGIAIIHDNEVKRFRSVGRIQNLKSEIGSKDVLGTMGIAHTRWATHGGVTKENTHPHSGCKQEIFAVHNGIIENYREIRSVLEKSGHTFTSETDSEVLVHLIESLYEGDLKTAVMSALSQVRGTYGLVVMHKDHPNTLIVARMGSPIAIGASDDGYYIASDATPILPHTKNVAFLEDGEIAEVAREGFHTYTLDNQEVQKSLEEIPWDDEQAEKQGFDHFMLKEIFDQPTVFEDAIRGRYNLDEGTAHLGGLNMTTEEMHNVKRIVLLACGTAYYAAMVGKAMFERLAGIPVEVDVASEFRYRDPIVDESTLVFAISQSGETADTLAAIREAKRRGARVRGIVNVVGSTIARETDGGTYIHAGPELSVASTKAYTNMLAILLLYAIQFGRLKRTSLATGKKLLTELQKIPDQMRKILSYSDDIKELAKKYAKYKNILFLGRGVMFPIALEGSHKLKEISYIHSEAYPAGEMKHGVNALLSPDFPVVCIATKNQLYEKMRSNIEEVRARKSDVIVVATEGDEDIQNLASNIIYIPDTMEFLQPFLAVIPFQLFAYHMAVHLDRDVDRPRNLAKSVTVE